MPYSTGDNGFGICKWIVNPTLGLGTHQTWAAATASASSGDIIGIMPGTYTEDLTLKSGVTYVALEDVSFGASTKVTLVGKMIDNGSPVVVSFRGIGFQTNSDYVGVLTAASNLVFSKCNISGTNHTPFSLGNASANVYLYNCYENLGTTGINIADITAGSFWGWYSQFGNTGNSVTAGTFSAGSIRLFGCTCEVPLTSSSTAVFQIQYCQFGAILTPYINRTWITTAGTATSIILNSEFYSGTATAVSVGSGTTVEFYNNVVNSSNTNAIDGAGTIITEGVTYPGTSFKNNVTTKTYKEFGDSGTYTPALTFGGGSTGLTYANRYGNWKRVGKLVWFSCNVELSAKGSSTGTAQITLPFANAVTPGAGGAVCIFAVSSSGLTFSGMVNARVAGSSDTQFVLDQWASGGSRTQLSNTAFTDSTFVQVTGVYTAA